MKRLLFGCILLLSACSMAPLMQDSGFQGIAVGANISEVECVYGEPYEMRTLPNGMSEYRYVQRIDCGSTAVEIIEYTFTVCQGKIVGKNRRQLGASTFGYQ